MVIDALCVNALLAAFRAGTHFFMFIASPVDSCFNPELQEPVHESSKPLWSGHTFCGTDVLLCQAPDAVEVHVTVNGGERTYVVREDDISRAIWGLDLAFRVLHPDLVNDSPENLPSFPEAQAAEDR